MPMMTSQILKSLDFTKTQDLDIWRTKHYFFFKQTNSLIAHEGLLYGKNSFAAEVTFEEM